MTNVNGLSWRQRQAIPVLLGNPDLEAVAGELGVNVRTLYRWLESDTFRVELLAAEGALIDQATRRLVVLVGKALDVLEAILDDKKAPLSQKRMAAEAVLNHLVKLRELHTVEKRLTDLERQIGAKGGTE